MVWMVLLLAAQAAVLFLEFTRIPAPLAQVVCERSGWTIRVEPPFMLKAQLAA